MKIIFEGSPKELKKFFGVGIDAKKLWDSMKKARKNFEQVSPSHLKAEDIKTGEV